MQPLMTSLEEIRSFHPCIAGWCNILEYRTSLAQEAGKPEPSYEEQFPLVSCLEAIPLLTFSGLSESGKRKFRLQ